MRDIYGNVPFRVELDSMKYQLMGYDLNFEFVNNEQVTISFEIDKERYNLINYKSNDIKSFDNGDDHL
jgi:hypothetical protein